MCKTKLLHGDCLERLPELAENSIDSCVTDSPYGLKFMSKKWDHDVPTVELWREVYRVLKPGAHLLSFFGTRTYHRGVVAIEDAGFEIRDQVGWLYATGFPKSLNVSKAIDKAAGAEGAAKEAAKQWDGWGTALKPAWEPIVVARKPFTGTVAANVLEHGTGAINVDACRVTMTNADAEFIRKTARPNSAGQAHEGSVNNRPLSPTVNVHQAGRFPANVIHDGSDEVLAEFAKYGEGRARGNISPTKQGKSTWFGNGSGGNDGIVNAGDTGTASRFFYSAKASKKERGEGNNHPTVKPIALMEYLIKLVTPPGGTVLDPFAGSGSTLIAAKALGFNSIGCEREEEYIEIIRARMKERFE